MIKNCLTESSLVNLSKDKSALQLLKIKSKIFTKCENYELILINAIKNEWNINKWDIENGKRQITYK